MYGMDWDKSSLTTQMMSGANVTMHVFAFNEILGHMYTNVSLLIL